MDFETRIDLDTPFGYLEGVPATFEVHVEEYPAEPYSWGGSRGTETAVSARFISLQLNNLTLLGKDLHAWLGQDQINHLEKRIEETYEDECTDWQHDCEHPHPDPGRNGHPRLVGQL